MKDFVDWLSSLLVNSEGDDAKVLADIIATNYSYITLCGNINEFRNKIVQLSDDTHKSTILNIIDSSWANWDGKKTDSSQTNNSKDDAGKAVTPSRQPVWGGFKIAPLVLVIILSVVLTIIMVWALDKDDFLSSMADIGVARGLITFLFTLGTIGISLLMISALFVSERDGLAERFSHGKEVLAALIAILGTVVGFYFGSQSSTGGVSSIELSPLTVSDANPQAESLVQIAALATKGRGPYRYDVNYQMGDGSARPEDMPPNVSAKKTDGLIVESFSPPKSISGKEVNIDVIVTDENQSTARLSGTKLKIR